MTARKQMGALIAGLLMMAGAWAAVPQSLSYQGYLTDRVGSPIMDSQTVTFSIYIVPVDGVPVWQETKSVAFSNGLFSVRLGELTSFPPDLFDVPLWLGMTIGTDSEMEPRRPLTSVGFSFRAEDADGLQGRSAAELDQSFHVDDVANPHVVTAGQTGAASQLGLDVHTTNAGNPHGVSVGQTGGISTTTFDAHLAPAVHHAPYTDAGALDAMGAQQDTNPLNHARFVDAEAVSAIIAVDGDGSGLDADLVDGLQATEIISAAAGAVAGVRYEFVGFSTQIVDGGVGWLGLYQACQSAFGSQSKMSTSAEILDTPLLVPASLEAWVRYSELHLVGTSIWDVSGGSATDLSRMHCNAWRINSSSQTGLSVDASNYTFQPRTCDVQRHVACSVPADSGSR